MVRPLVRALILTAIGGAALSSSTKQAPASIPRDPSAVGYLDLTKRHPDGLDGRQDFDRSFTTAEALRRLEQMRGFLRSFGLLTSKVRRQLSQSELNAIDNTGLDLQTLGFHNIPLIVEGTLLKQAYQLAQSRYELALLQHEQGRIADESVAEARRAYEAATKQFQRFWDTKRPGD